MATERAATWNTVLVNSPAILYMLGIISSRPWLAVKVVVSEPALQRAVARARRAAFGLHFDDAGVVPQIFGRPMAPHSSACSPIGDDGVIG